MVIFGVEETVVIGEGQSWKELNVAILAFMMLYGGYLNVASCTVTNTSNKSTYLIFRGYRFLLKVP